MTRLALAALVATGLVAALALDRRARREPGSRLPWVFLAVAVAVESLASLVSGLLDGTAAGLTATVPSSDGAYDVLLGVSFLRACAIPLLGVGLLLLPHVPARRGRTIQRGVDVAISALSFAIVWIQLTPQPLHHTYATSTLRVMYVLDAAFVATAVVYVLARARVRGGLPYLTLLALCAGVFLPILGSELSRPAAHLGTAGLVAGAADRQPRLRADGGRRAGVGARCRATSG